jgi:hypothetical protein
MNVELSPSPLSISYRSLLAIYILLPLFAGIIALDILFFSNTLRQAIPADPYTWRIITVFLIYPHIVASTFGLFDETYFSYYKENIAKGLALALGLTFALPLVTSAQTQFLVLATYTIHHVITQQIGIATLMWGKPDKIFKIWKWVFLSLALVAYLRIYSDDFLPVYMSANAPYNLTNILFLVLAFTTYRLSRRSKTKWGSSYLWANCFLIFFVLYSSAQGYVFFAILGPRIVHDLSAFVFYVAHDHNRNDPKAKNLIFRMFSPRIPLVLIGPVCAIALANLFLSYQSHYWMERFLVAISFFHYYLEGFIWKRGSPHRRALMFKEARLEGFSDKIHRRV